MPGFVSVIGCRIIPQEIPPLGIQHGPILWSCVFEIICDFDGSTMFFLHGREESGIECVYHGSLKCVNRFCNLLLLEVESMKKDNEAMVPFSKLGFRDRKKLLEVTTSQVRLEVPDVEIRSLFPRSRDDFANFEEDLVLLKERREFLIQMTQMNKLDSIHIENKENSQREVVGSMQLLEVDDISTKSRDYSKAFSFPPHNENGHTQCIKRKSIGGYFWSSFKHIIGISSSIDDNVVNIDQQHNMVMETRHDRRTSTIDCSIVNNDQQHNTIVGTRSHQRFDQKHNTIEETRDDRTSTIDCSVVNIDHQHSTNHEKKHARIQEFLRSSDSLRLTLRALNAKLSSFRGWPNMNKNWFALYKMPLQVPTKNQDYAGLWGGTFGWHHKKPSTNKPKMALFFLMLSYEESKGQKLLIGTKILEGTNYALHPNGSSMFIVNINEPSCDPFPWNNDRDSLSLNAEHAFLGEGIANGYGFKYPGSKPGSLFVFQNGTIAFVWKESRDVLTLQRVNLQELLKKGERIASLPPINNFSYLMKSNLNVFTSFSSTSIWSSSPKFGLP
ncbi:F-box protein At5g39450-like [Cicer arietinum]|nr:putative F-box protein At5g39480 isoform X2 [Cicer arietinum]